ncbi:hypothetical protein [Streptococcus marimammalium]|uniref:hypothetical protein n=1 Tax=Streptococcus marimammalium TaxID=269666 RepID=UPI000378AAF6|nr:hypothetical protein [Streptococcus marimammalium]
MQLFKKKSHHQDSFKRLIHRLSIMSESELSKVNQLLDVVFDSKSQNISLEEVVKTPVAKELILDDSITEAKNKLNTEQLERRIEQFKQMKKPK